VKFDYHVTINADRDRVWAVLSDFPRAASLMPDVSEVQQQEDGSYQGEMRVRVGPIGLNLKGMVEVEQDERQGRWNMRARAQDRRAGGGVRASIEVILREQSQAESELDISADVQLMGRLGELGQPLIRRKADSTIQEFTENLRRAVSGKA
jgi:carbon monoxide dehydrogenase subunit G